MHMYLKDANFFGGNGIVGAQVPVGAGLALAAKYYQYNGLPTEGPCERVSISMFGDGAANQGQIYEAMNIAALLRLPAIFVCENNHYGMGTSHQRANANIDFFNKYEPLPGVKGDGMNVLAVRALMDFAIGHCKAGHGPIVLELDTYRYHGHSMSDPGVSYRSRDEVVSTRKERDPIEMLRRVVVEAGWATEEELTAVEKKVRADVDAAVEFAKTSPEPPLASLVREGGGEGLTRAVRRRFDGGEAGLHPGHGNEQRQGEAALVRLKKTQICLLVVKLR
jgi:pyruvate dehydrogenase E1 component alpha subunit